MSIQITPIQIMPWQFQDIESCSQIASEASGLQAWSFDDYRTSFISKHFGLIAFMQQQAVGCLVAQSLFETLDLLDIQVLPQFQGQGVAQELMLRLLEEYSDIDQIMLEVRESNLRAQQFYKKTGFEAISIRKNYYAAKCGHAAENAVIMQLKLQN